MWWAQLLNNQAALYGGGFVPVGDFESIATVTVGAGGASSITFSSIPSDYTHLQIRALWNIPSGGGEINTQFNGDTTGSDYWRHFMQGDGSSAGAGANNYNGFMGYNTGTNFTALVTDILDYTNTNKIKVTRTLWGNDTNGGGYIGFASGKWNSTAALTQIVLVSSGSPFAQYSSFALYGIKG